MLVSGNMYPKKNGSEGRETFLFAEKILSHILFYDPFVSHSTTKKQLVVDGSQAIKKIILIVLFMFYLNQFFFFFFSSNWQQAIEFTESEAFCLFGRVTGNNNKFLLGLSPLVLRVVSLESVYSALSDDV